MQPQKPLVYGKEIPQCSISSILGLCTPLRCARAFGRAELFSLFLYAALKGRSSTLRGNLFSWFKRVVLDAIILGYHYTERRKPLLFRFKKVVLGYDYTDSFSGSKM